MQLIKVPGQIPPSPCRLEVAAPVTAGATIPSSNETRLQVTEVIH
jgi:hypothetical protein